MYPQELSDMQTNIHDQGIHNSIKRAQMANDREVIK